TTTLVLIARATTGSGTVVWSSGAPGYTVMYTSPAGTTGTDAVTVAVLSGASNTDDTVTLTLASALASGGAVTISAVGANPTSPGSADEFTVTPGNGTSETTTNSLTYGWSVTAATADVVPAVAGELATYTIGFRTTTAAPAGADIFFSETGTDFSHVTGILVTDSTQGWHSLASGASLSQGSAAVPLAYGVLAGDSLSVVLLDVVNPLAGGIGDFSIWTTADNVPVAAAPYTISPSTSAGVGVAVFPSTTGALATYTVFGLRASRAITGEVSTLTLAAPAGTVFPNVPSDYSLQDSTNATGSGTVTAPLAGGGSNVVTLTIPRNISGDDNLALTVTDVINPTGAGTYTISLKGDVVGAPSPPFPDAGTTYPNGAIVSFGGSLYVFAGGHAFGVASPSVLAAIKRADHASVQVAPAGASPPPAPARPGTLISTGPVNRNSVIWVVGVDGQLHGFASPAQFLGDGYDPALVITVPSLGGLTIGVTAGAAGQAADAVSTSADGAIVDSSGTYFVFAGGKAFGVASPAKLAALRAADGATPLDGTVTFGEIGTTIASGVILSVVGGGVYVTDGGELWPFKTQAQLIADGYGGTPAVPVPSQGGVPVVWPYSGS
ncbi:MAG TPA: hypothetical protein VED59_01685, partial [Acidimicrobiales bacterium]|nr:hypothetical protein [Acidimicrobiales bacterium]